jgi:DNA-binding MarR family transcriptional regulator
MAMTQGRTNEELDWNEIGMVYEGMAFASRPFRSVTDQINKRHDLGPRGTWILLMIANGCLHPLDIATLLNIGRSLVTAELGRLERAQLLVARKSAADQRRTELTLTAAGAGICDEVRAAMTAMLHERWAQYEPDQIRLCAQMLRDFRTG